VLKGLHVLGGPLAGIHPGLVAHAALTDQLYVGVGLGDLTLDVVQGRPGADQVIAASGDLGVKIAQLGKLGQGRLAMRDLVQSRIQRLQIKQTPLTARVGFQDVPPVISLVPSLEAAPITKSHGSVHSVQM
jgi:hypothetical protein